ncbi:MAG: hypothetical protein V4720_06285 [Pseudomonadota bacterium]
MTTQTAAEAYAARTRQINDRLARLVEMQAKGGRHAGTRSADLHWGHVGDLEAIAAKLKEITDACFKEGEYAA